MGINYALIGLILTALGALVLTLNNIFTGWYQRNENEKGIKRYSWLAWIPFYKNTQTLKWHVNWDHTGIVDWFLPPKHILEILGFLLILIGTILQIIELYV